MSIEMHRAVWSALRTHCFHDSRMEGNLVDIWKWAIDDGNMTMLDCLLDNGFSVESHGKRSYPMLAYAASNNKITMVSYLKSRGASVHNMDWELTTVMPLVLNNLDPDISDSQLVTIVEALYDGESPYEDVSYYADFSEQAKNMDRPLAASCIAGQAPR